MKMLLAYGLLLMTTAFAQEEFAVRLNEKGLVKILQMVTKYATGEKGRKSYPIPADIRKFTLKKEKLLSYPLVSVVNDISDLDLNSDLDFYLYNSEIKIDGKIDRQSIKTSISNPRSNGFDLILSINVPELKATAKDLSLCEDRNLKKTACGDGLKAKLKGLKISSVGPSINIIAKFRIRTDGKMASAEVKSVSTNLESSKIVLDINFDSIEVPEPVIIINGQETVLKTTKLKDEILKRKVLLSKKLLGFFADFIASDAAGMINRYLANKEVSTAFSLTRNISEPQNSVLFHPVLPQSIHQSYSDNTHIPVNPRLIQPANPQKEIEPLRIVMESLAYVIRKVQLDIGLKNISTPLEKDIELAGEANFYLNDKKMTVKDSIGNSNTNLPDVDLSFLRKNDVSFALSETMINGALDLASSTGLFTEIVYQFAKEKGLTVKSLKLHFHDMESFVVVGNVELNLNKLSSDGSIGSVLGNWIGAKLERNNNGGKIYFPLEIQIYPILESIEGKTKLSFKVLSPFYNTVFEKDDFKSTQLYNTYNYPSNLNDVSGMVKKKILSKFYRGLSNIVDRTYLVDVSEFLNQSGVEFMPKYLSIEEQAYLVLGVDIVDINFNKNDKEKK